MYTVNNYIVGYLHPRLCLGNPCKSLGKMRQGKGEDKSHSACYHFLKLRALLLKVLTFKKGGLYKEIKSSHCMAYQLITHTLTDITVQKYQ